MQSWHESWAREAYRVLKPGGHLLAFGGSRTYHRLVVAIEDAGFEIRDQLQWLYGQGFPKSHNLTGEWEGWGTALKPAHEPIVLARKPLIGTVAANVERHGTGALNIDGCRIEGNVEEMRGRSGVAQNGNRIYGEGVRNPTDDIWQPAHLGRWPANVLLDEEAAALLDAQSGSRGGGRATGRDDRPSRSRNGYGPGDEDGWKGAWHRSGEHYGDSGGASRFFYTAKSSRSERNAGLGSTCTVKYTFSSKESESCAATAHELQRVTSDIPTVRWRTDESGASITAQCPRDSLSTTLTAIRQITPSTISPSLTLSRTSASIAGANCETANGGSLVDSAESSSEPTTTSTSARTASPQHVSNAVSAVLSLIRDADAWKPDTNGHPCVKPVALMRWLVRLITPPGGTVLDPFMGSGTTGIACVHEHVAFIGIEQDAEYMEIARKRIAHARGPIFALAAD